ACQNKYFYIRRQPIYIISIYRNILQPAGKRQGEACLKTGRPPPGVRKDNGSLTSPVTRRAFYTCPSSFPHPTAVSWYDRTTGRHIHVPFPRIREHTFAQSVRAHAAVRHRRRPPTDVWKPPRFHT